ncbi:MAG: GDSL-type esterase/lipase family protein [Elainellaceae cyanobacterium]
MVDRNFDDMRRTAARSIRFAQSSAHWKLLPTWCYLSLGANLLLVALLGLWGWRGSQVTASPSQSPSQQTDGMAIASSNSTSLDDVEEAESTVIAASDITTAAAADLGPRHKLTYSDWIDILSREADAVATNPPEHLSVLMGDSISLWFPHDLLPRNTTWLNQGISGEVSAGLLKRLNLIEDTDPDVIFLLIGINDLVRDVSDTTLLANQQQIVRGLKAMHPNAEIVVQSILPHGGAAATWEGRDRLAAIPITRILNLNEQLQAIAREEGVEFLDIYSLFSNVQGYLRMELSTDGIHLNDSGYLVWASALQIYHQVELTQE